jgi:carbon monoxide dehydrogenase subunit G
LYLLFKKEYVINSEIEKVWSFLTDIKMVTDCIPYLEGLQIESPTRFIGKIKPPYSFIRGKFNINSEIEKVQEKERLKIIVKGSSIGSSFEITMHVVILPVEGTKIQLDVEVKTFGLLKPLPKSLIYKAVDDIEKLMLSSIKERLEDKSLY